MKFILYFDKTERYSFYFLWSQHDLKRVGSKCRVLVVVWSELLRFFILCVWHCNLCDTSDRPVWMPIVSCELVKLNNFQTYIRNIFWVELSVMAWSAMPFGYAAMAVQKAIVFKFYCDTLPTFYTFIKWSAANCCLVFQRCRKFNSWFTQ